MDPARLAALVRGLTDQLAPAAGTPAHHIARLRHDLSEVLQSQPVEEVVAPGSSLLDRIQHPSEIAELTGPPVPLPAAVPAASPLRAFRREVPAVTSQYPASVPAWAAGQHIVHTLGPYVDRLGKRVWFDFYAPRDFVRVLRGSEIILLIPIRGVIDSVPELPLAAGTVWIRSRLLAASAPAGAYTGLRVRGGRISFSALSSVSPNTLVVGPSDECELRLTLDQPVPTPATDTPTGDDAEDVTLELPGEAQIRVKPGGAVVEHAGEMRMRVYGRNYRFRINGQPASFEPQLHRILVPFDGRERDVTVADTASSLFMLSGTARVVANAWALPVTVATPEQLGEAAGVGAIAVRIDAGLSATWHGLVRGPAHLDRASLVIEPGSISLAGGAAARRGTQRFELWEYHNKEKEVRTVADLRYVAPFELLYNSRSDGSETTIVGGLELELRVDRPMTAARQRPRLDAPQATAAMFEVKGERVVYLHAANVLQQLAAAKRFEELTPVSYALTNAFLEVSAVDRVTLAGRWSGVRGLEEGGLALFFRVLFLLPTLPDPYVSSFNPLGRERRGLTRVEPAAAGGRQPDQGVYFAALVRWTSPASPVLSFTFVRTPTGVPLPILPSGVSTEREPPAHAFAFGSSTSGPNRAAEAWQEDERNVAALREEFEHALPPLRDRDLRRDHIYLLDVSTTADLFGVGFPLLRQQRETPFPFPFAVVGMDLVTAARLARVYTLPQIQWEAVRTIQNPTVAPYPFPSPVTSPDTGNPTLLETESYALVPIAPRPLVEELVAAFNAPGQSRRIAALFSLPFGMQAGATIENPFDATKRGAQVGLNAPDFPDEDVRGGCQIRVVATSPFAGPKAESPGLRGATIQLRNLVELLTGSVPLDAEGKPLSVLGPVVDTVFNREFKPGGARPRVPVRRLDLSGYGATLFSDWLNPTAQIAATSQARFDVLIGRTAHEIIQVKSLLYPWAVPVVRTITIQRTAGGGVTRHDSGWKAQGPGEYDFSYYTYDESTDTTTLHANPYEVHRGAVKGVFHVTQIRDTGRIHRQLHPDPLNQVEMQEVFFDCDVSVEDVRVGGAGGFVPSRQQRGFVQLAPYQRPLSATQFQRLLAEEGGLGGGLECVISVGDSGQPMTVVRVDVSAIAGPSGPVFVAAAHGSVHLPGEGSWSMVKRGIGGPTSIGEVNEHAGVPLIREGALGTVSSKPYRLADPPDLFNETNPATDYGLLHATSSEKTLYLRPTIARGASTIESTLRPRFADPYALLDARALFPDLDKVFELGPGGTSLQILGGGRLRLNTAATLNVAPGYTRDLMHTGGSRIYVDYSIPGVGTSEASVTFDSTAAVPWTAAVKRHSLVMDLGSFKGIMRVSSDHVARFGEEPRLNDPKIDLGPPLDPVVDLLRFLGGFDLAQAFDVSMGNAGGKSTQTKWKASIRAVKVDFESGPPPYMKIYVGPTKVSGPAIPPVNPTPALKIKLKVKLGAYYSMLPLSASEEGKDSALVRAGKLSAGGFFKFEGELAILCFTIAGAGVYLLGLLRFEIAVDSKKGSKVVYRFALGLETAIKLPVVGKVLVALGVGVEFEDSSKGHAFLFLFFIRGQAELLGGAIAIVISIEAKGGQRTELQGGNKVTYGVCVVEFALEISLAFVINIDFSITWEEKKQLS